MRYARRCSLSKLRFEVHGFVKGRWRRIVIKEKYKEDGGRRIKGRRKKGKKEMRMKEKKFGISV